MSNARFVFPEGKTKSLTMSYDDGPVEDRQLVGIFNQYGIRGTFHLNSGRFDSESASALQEVKELYKGHEISCHGVSHPFLERLPKLDVMREIWKDRERLEQIAGYPVVSASYPFGTYNDEIISVLKSAGIQCCRTVNATKNFGIPKDFLEWHPTCHHNDALDLIPKFESQKYPLTIFFVWGHSFEFSRNDSWKIIEDFCKRMSGKSDVWYATNIEICRYIKAIHALDVSTDGHIIYNPSAVEIWFKLDEHLSMIKPGETVSF